MRNTIGLEQFFLGVTAFDLCNPEGSNPTPCLVRVGPRRFLERKLDVEQCRCRCYYYRDGTLICHQDLPIPFTQRRGMPYFDAEAFLKQLGCDCSPCGSDSYRWHKNSRLSDTVEATQLGLCTARVSWLDIDVYHVHLHYRPGTLTLCGRPVDYISWESFDEACYVGCDRVRDWIRKSLERPHDLSGEDLLPHLPEGSDFWFNEMYISAGDLSVHLVRALGAKIIVQLGDKTLRRKLPGHTPRQDLELLIRILQQPDLESVKAVLP